MEMIRILFAVTLIALPIFGQEPSIESGWKKIQVFKTKRAEIEKILGKPRPDVDKIHTIYPTADGNVVISYSDEPCSSSISDKGDYKLDKDTVMDYQVYLKKPFPLSGLKWNKESYDGSKDAHVLDVFQYYNRGEGVWITTQMVNGTEMVQSFWFLSTDEQKRRFCCKK